MLGKIKSFRWGYILLFLMLAAIGVCFIAFQDTLPTLALVIGIILIIYGVFAGVIALADKKRGGKFAFRVTVALICVICGLVTAVLRESAVDILASLIGLFLVMDGSFKLHTAAMSKRYKLLSWWLMVVPAALVILGGFASLKLDRTEMVTLSWIIGITMIIDAVANFMSAFYVGGFEKRLVREIRQEINLENEKKALAEAQSTEALPSANSAETLPSTECAEAQVSENAEVTDDTDEVTVVEADGKSEGSDTAKAAEDATAASPRGKRAKKEKKKKAKN